MKHHANDEPNVIDLSDLDELAAAPAIRKLWRMVVLHVGSETAQIGNSDGSHAAKWFG